MTERLRLNRGLNGNQVGICRIDALGSDRDNRPAEATVRQGPPELRFDAIFSVRHNLAELHRPPDVVDFPQRQLPFGGLERVFLLNTISSTTL